MIKSMTGYGKAEAILPEGKLRIEIKTLNGKNADINIKTPLLPKDKDLLVRRKLAEELVRGTIDFFVTWEPAAGSQVRQINPETVAEYYSQIKKIEESLGIDSSRTEGAVLSAILRFPDLTDSVKTDIINDGNWDTVEQAIDSAIAAVNDYRAKEGAALYRDVTSRVGNILDLYGVVESHEAERIESVKERIRKNLESLGQPHDPARFEQELVFYVEKLDINEEKVRLRQHCKYFMDTIDGEEYPGRKLGFILQEMGREINTTGSKANHAGIQKAVVRMKDELEKIREQSMNIL